LGGCQDAAVDNFFAGAPSEATAAAAAPAEPAAAAAITGVGTFFAGEDGATSSWGRLGGCHCVDYGGYEDENYGVNTATI